MEQNSKARQDKAKEIPVFKKIKKSVLGKKRKICWKKAHHDRHLLK